MTRWTFRNPVEIHFGNGAVQNVSSLLKGPESPLIVTSAGCRRRQAAWFGRFAGARILDDVTPNPNVEHVEDQLRRVGEVSEIVAVGGGSVLDTAKILAAVGGAKDFSLLRDPLPAVRRTRLICVPTTAGTGSEVTPFATVWDAAARKKYSVAGPSMFPDVAVLDPELTLSLPEEVTLATGLDALTHAFESTWSRRANPVSTAFAVRAIRSIVDVLPRLRERPGDLGMRAAMLEASLLAGLAISETRTALCHSISYPITAAHGVPHGFACSFTLPEVFAFNAGVAPMENVARDLGFASADHLRQRLHALLAELEVGRWIGRWVDDAARLVALAPEMLTPGRADNNVRQADVNEVRMIVDRACRGRGITASGG